MSDFNIVIDGKECGANKGQTVLDVAEEAGIKIPVLCYDKRMDAYGGCRFCTVEAESRGRTSLVAACLYPVEKDLIVRTRTEKVDKIRRVILELLMAHAPDAFEFEDLAVEYGANRDYFESDASFCVHCGLCVRYCAEIKKANALLFVDKGKTREIAFIPEIASTTCWDCKECMPLCPTEALQAAFVLARAFMAPSA